jgi:hypothetical protein
LVEANKTAQAMQMKRIRASAAFFVFLLSSGEQGI